MSSDESTRRLIREKVNLLPNAARDAVSRIRVALAEVEDMARGGELNRTQQDAFYYVIGYIMADLATGGDGGR